MAQVPTVIGLLVCEQVIIEERTRNVSLVKKIILGDAPFFQMFGTAHFRLLRNADDPTKFIQVIEYETPESFELNRQSLASDARFQAYLQMWRAMLPGALEVDVYQEI